ncbi:MAG: hypothetical protein NOF05_21035 [Candidatus Accumulibacter phosphatis]|uniref:Uncharacterized protein n=2 Tax=Candidatus Accumulibacter TaxID=327159 RepID=A0A080MBA3_9PROT|nr:MULTISPECIES: hypothetical protein [Candidatus Accumulibacter]KFB78508.1 MAG: hypothetical protein AW06_000121 [Candidatus Accumulibacter cognatus]MBL8400843.1 hypothetical protein [Accumulibacter sp.]MBN8516902.1 hypothetical protein [Accumulibacter sp.]MBO3712344.1 hypothetical protein [Accumulibacter sp.]MCC2867491.1 hypothetical protein [Candidatus Accumulibacter phosphatis]
MGHPVLVKAGRLIQLGNIVGAEAALASLAESDGDDALVVALDDFPAKDLLAVLRDFDSSRESVVNLLVSPEQFARAIVLERRYGEQSHERLHGMINSVVFRAGSDPGEFLEAIGEFEGGCEVLADYLCERVENVEHFFKTATFDFFADAEESADDMTDEERLDALADPGVNRPFLTHNEVNDHDWMELTWILRYQYPEIFRDVLLILRARSRAEELVSPDLARPRPADRSPVELGEESAL